jgi:hypothetical protein
MHRRDSLRRAWPRLAAPGRAWPRLAASPGALGSAGAETDRQGGAGDGRRRRLAIAMPTALTLALATVE